MGLRHLSRVYKSSLYIRKLKFAVLSLLTSARILWPIFDIDFNRAYIIHTSSKILIFDRFFSNRYDFLAFFRYFYLQLWLLRRLFESTVHANIAASSHFFIFLLRGAVFDPLSCSKVLILLHHCFSAWLAMQRDFRLTFQLRYLSVRGRNFILAWVVFWLVR